MKLSSHFVNDLKKNFALRLRELRIASHLTGAELGALAGVNKGTMSKFENPEFDVFPSYVTLVALARALGVSLDHLTGCDDKPPEARLESPKWLVDLLPDLETLDKSGQKAVMALVKGLAKK